MKKNIVKMLLLAGVLGLLAGCSKEKEEPKEEVKAEATATPEAPVEAETLESLNLEEYVKLGTYKGIVLEAKEVTVTDEEVENAIAERLALNPLEVPEGVAEEGDLVNISYVGTLDGVAFEGGSAENYDITIGSGRFIPGFETGMVGMKTGETKDLNLTFPDNYNEELGGKEVVFKVTMNKVSRTPDTLTLEWIAANSEVKTVEEYKQLVKTELLNARNEDAEEERKVDAWQQVVEGSEILKYPDFLLEEGENMLREEISYYAQMSGMDLKSFLAAQNVTEEDFEKQCEEFGKSIAAQKLIMQAIKEAEGMKDADEEAQTILAGMAEQVGMTPEEVLANYGEENMYQNVTLERVCGLILENATVN